MSFSFGFTCGVDAKLQARWGLWQDELEPLRSLWFDVIKDLHLHKLVPFSVNKVQNLGGQTDEQINSAVGKINWKLCFKALKQTERECYPKSIYSYIQ